MSQGCCGDFAPRKFTIYFVVLTLDYAILFDQGLRTAMWEENPKVSFHASSPSNGALLDDMSQGMFIHNAGSVLSSVAYLDCCYSDAFSPDYGDTRHYDYTDDCSDVSLYPRGKFIGEYGWQSYPSLETLKAATIPEDWDNNSTVMNSRQHHPKGNAGTPDFQTCAACADSMFRACLSNPELFSSAKQPKQNSSVQIIYIPIASGASLLHQQPSLLLPYFAKRCPSSDNGVFILAVQ